MSLKTGVLMSLFLVMTVLPASANGIDCGYYNEIEITDPAGDASAGASPSIDILSVELRQIGADLEFTWRSNGSTYDSEDIDSLLFFDIDGNPETGRQNGGIGAEITMWIWTLGSEAVLGFYDEDGNHIGDGDVFPQVTFSGDGYTFKIPVAELSTDGFTFYFDVSGGDPSGSDFGSAHEISLEPVVKNLVVAIQSDGVVDSVSPTLINLTEEGVGVGIRTFLTGGATLEEIVPPAVDYTVYHESPQVNDPESIISIDANGYAYYNDEGYVFATATVTECGVTSEPFVIATGELYRDPVMGQVLAVWPPDFSPEGVDLTYDEIMTAYPNYLHMMNVAYQLSSEFYRGFLPYDGDNQILAVLLVDSWCHPGNPFLSPPACYFSGIGGPTYVPMIHEMGHNFHNTEAMLQLFGANSSRFGSAGVPECVASLPVNHMALEIFLNGDQYDLGPGTFEWDFFAPLAVDDNFVILEDFEAYLDAGLTAGFFDTTGVMEGYDKVSLFCSFFQAYIFEYADYRSQHGHDMIRRFLNVWNNEAIPDLQEDKIDTYFAASYCAAVGKDARDELRHWGFDVDDAFYDQIMPMIEARIELFADRFEYGNLRKWSKVVP